MQIIEQTRQQASQISDILASGTSLVSMVDHILYAGLALVIAGPLTTAFAERGVFDRQLVEMFHVGFLTIFLLHVLPACLHLMGQVIRLAGRR